MTCILSMFMQKIMDLNKCKQSRNASSVAYISVDIASVFFSKKREEFLTLKYDEQNLKIELRIKFEIAIRVLN
jgi:hypothetical protein